MTSKFFFFNIICINSPSFTTFTYDGDGNRIRKVSGDLTVDYIVIGGTIYGEIRTENGTTTTLHYLFDENGTRIGFVVNGADTYYYRFNLQGDVTGIFNESGTLVVQYTYDAWGKLEDMSGSTLIGLLNPIRYRGYYYDIETGFYYLQSRYYDPETCRFINADGVIAAVDDSVQGYNQFAYCFNNPINMEDETGHWPKWVKKAAKAVGNFVKKVAIALEESFQIEVGVGVGLDFSSTAGNSKIAAGIYQDGYTFGYSNGEDYTSIKQSAGASLSVLGLGFDGSLEAEHRHETNGKWVRDGIDAFSSPWEVYNSENTTITEPQGVGVKDFTFDNDFVISYNVSAHFILGGHFSVGINVDRFVEVFCES